VRTIAKKRMNVRELKTTCGAPRYRRAVLVIL
jgi:hypothetical protein